MRAVTRPLAREKRSPPQLPDHALPPSTSPLPAQVARWPSCGASSGTRSTRSRCPIRRRTPRSRAFAAPRARRRAVVSQATAGARREAIEGQRRPEVVDRGGPRARRGEGAQESRLERLRRLFAVRPRARPPSRPRSVRALSKNNARFSHWERTVFPEGIFLYSVLLRARPRPFVAHFPRRTASSQVPRGRRVARVASDARRAAARAKRGVRAGRCGFVGVGVAAAQVRPGARRQALRSRLGEPRRRAFQAQGPVRGRGVPADRQREGAQRRELHGGCRAPREARGVRQGRRDRGASTSVVCLARYAPADAAAAAAAGGETRMVSDGGAPFWPRRYDRR